MMRRSALSFSLLAGVSCALLPHATVHRGGEPFEAETTLPTVVVIGVTPLQGAELDRNQVAAPVQTATSRDIDRSHALDLTAFMNRTLGSVHVNDIQNNPLQPDINYRGYTASPLLGTPQGLSVYLDGVRLNQPFGDVVSWDLIPRAAISSITLMPGSNPLFGLNTLGGALSMRTKDGLSDPGTSVAGNLRLATSAAPSSSNRRPHSERPALVLRPATCSSDDGWRDDSPTDVASCSASFGWRDEARTSR